MHFRERLEQLRGLILEVTAEEVEEKLMSGADVVVVDCRQRDEIAEGRIEEAYPIPFGLLEMELPLVVEQRDQEVILVCAGGTRSLYAAQNLREIGFTNVASMAGGFGRWKQMGAQFRVFPLEPLPEDPEAEAEAVSTVPTITAAELAGRLEGEEKPLVVDVREDDETVRGFVPGAVTCVRGRFIMRLESFTEDRKRPIVVVSSRGVRAAYAAPEALALGYEDVVVLEGGLKAWQEAGYALEVPRALTPQAKMRYSRHLLIPEIGEEGQYRLLQSRVLLMGAGGLGSPAAYYLAAAGVGTLGIIDSDVVDRSNLQRQILHNDQRVGMPKVESARQTLHALNPDVKIKTWNTWLTRENVDGIFGEGWDVVVDGGDNFPTRYLINDACVHHNIPCVHGSVYRFEGQVTVFKPHAGPCYRCLYPEPPPPELAPSCAEAGVLGVLPGIIGMMQATEAIKVLLGVGEDLTGRLIHVDALQMKFRELKVQRDPACPVCAEGVVWPGYVDYQRFCGVR